MSRNLIIVIVVVAVIALAALAFAFFREPEQASAPIEAVPVLVETEPATAVAAAPAAEPAATQAPTATPTQAEAPTVTEPTAAAVPTAEPTATMTTEPAPAASSPVIFEIVQDESQARFIIDEVLRGAPKTVVGTTNQVAGQIAIDPANPGATELGQILVNARTLATDNEFRNRAVKNRILQTDSYEFVTFTPTELSGLPEEVAVGQPFSFQIAGDLTIRDTTLPVTFEATVTPVSETRLEGVASTTVLYADFGLVIPDAPSVQSVEDDVTLELEFVATAV